ncbi:MAG: hypothetical protein LZF60_380108 [Nitrospira sp.]|nr:MAG: hypothetical protein LZF60_380108 [Nitrospira sp.]
MIPATIVDLLHTGVSVNVGTRDADLMPECTRGWGIWVGADRTAVTLLLTESASAQTLDNLRNNGLIAITCSRPTDHVTCQLKGTVTRIRPATPQDYVQQQAWRRAFLGELIAVGVPAEQTDAIIMQPAVAIEMQVTGVFAQTPGPGAGEQV